ncbi:response regulator transcription factor [Noviherbaspirillum sp. CPCC 100848]|uniref:Response regulator transcription factor n=1 Tax=Noviherbaspirillum album TaxID=3080276 RepID=A0ABU6JCU7_9BURK|nr:response regulator transcription factor [Noviherbaspirillum sp. CPCC 100848]MEC4721472.1 response regulator transcription factor [Noviherbaspirillum sp. CPCC 100848]
MRIAFHTKDSALAETIAATLSGAGHDCMQLDSAHGDSGSGSTEDMHVCLIDWQDGNGAGLLQQLREHSPALPVLALTERNRIEEALAAVAAGAADYLVKPVRRNELALRIEVLLRRAYPAQEVEDESVFGPYCFEPRRARVTRNGETLDLTQKEFELALLFFRNLDRPLSRTFIKDAVWSRDSDLPSRTMDTHVSRVRAKLGLRPENGFRLVPVYSYGYRLEELLRPPPR